MPASACSRRACGSSPTRGCCTTTSGFHYFFFKNDIDAALAHCAARRRCPARIRSSARLAARARAAAVRARDDAVVPAASSQRRRRQQRGARRRRGAHARGAARGRSRSTAGRRRHLHATRSGATAAVAAGARRHGPARGDPRRSVRRATIDPTTGAVRSVSGRVPSRLHDSSVPRAARRVAARAMTTPSCARRGRRPSSSGSAAPRRSPPRRCWSLRRARTIRHKWTMRRLLALHELDLVVRRRRDLRPDRPQRRRQDDHVQAACSACCARARARAVRGQPLGVRGARRYRLPARATVLLRLPHRAGDAHAVRASLRPARPRRARPASPR